MCDPTTALTVASIASTVGGAFAQNQQQEAQRSAMRRAGENYSGRLGEIQNQADAVMGKSVDHFGADAQAEQMAAQRASQLEKVRQNVVPVASAGDVTAKSANPVVGDMYNKVAQTALQQGLAQGARAASLNAWSNNRFLNDLSVARSGQEIGKLSNFAQGWAPVYQAEMAGAKNAGSGWGTLGSVLQGVGTLSSIGAGASAGGLFGSPGGGLTPANTAHNFVNASGQTVGISPSAQWVGGNFYVPAY